MALGFLERDSCHGVFRASGGVGFGALVWGLIIFGPQLLELMEFRAELKGFLAADPECHRSSSIELRRRAALTTRD